MNCPECSTELNWEDRTLAYYYKCSKCGFEKLEYNEKKCCLFPNHQPVRYYTDFHEAMLDTDEYTIYNQCKNCGRKIGTAISKTKFKKSEIEPFDTLLVGRTNELKTELYKLQKDISDRKIQRRSDDFWADNDTYLQSDKWKEIRKLVFERDNYKCQSCLIGTADEVHHMDGRFRKNEPLFTLISVCNRCHKIITEIERGNHRDAAIIKYSFDDKSLKID